MDTQKEKGKRNPSSRGSYQRVGGRRVGGENLWQFFYNRGLKCSSAQILTQVKHLTIVKNTISGIIWGYFLPKITRVD